MVVLLSSREKNINYSYPVLVSLQPLVSWCLQLITSYLTTCKLLQYIGENSFLMHKVKILKLTGASMDEIFNHIGNTPTSSSYWLLHLGVLA